MEITNKVKRQPSEWEEIIANEATYKELISRIYKQLIQLNTRKKTKQNKNRPIKKWEKDLKKDISLKKTYWFLLMDDRKSQNSIKQLSFN